MTPPKRWRRPIAPHPRSSRRPADDIVFYNPFIGLMLSNRRTLPPGGAETQILMLAKALAGRGVRVAIIVYGEPDELPAEVEGVRVVPRPPYNLAHKRLVGKVLECGQIWSSLRRAPSPTIVYRCASLELGLVGLYAKCTRRRLVFSTASISDFRPRQLMSKARDRVLYRLGLRLTALIVAQTDEQAQLCETLLRRRAEPIPSLSPVIGRRDLEPEAFLWVGRLVSYKQPLAYVELARAFPEARFWMVGVPDAREAPLARAVAAAASGVRNLELLEPRPHAEVGQLMDRAVASVNTASFEGMPNTLLEAWSRGVPALVLHHDPGGVVSKYGLGGFANDSPERLAELARWLWHERSDREELAQRCLSYIASNHSPDAVASRWIETLQLRPTLSENSDRRTVQPACAG